MLETFVSLVVARSRFHLFVFVRERLEPMCGFDVSLGRFSHYIIGFMRGERTGTSARPEGHTHTLVASFILMSVTSGILGGAQLQIGLISADDLRQHKPHTEQSEKRSVRSIFQCDQAAYPKIPSLEGKLSSARKPAQNMFLQPVSDGTRWFFGRKTIRAFDILAKRCFIRIRFECDVHD